MKNQDLKAGTPARLPTRGNVVYLADKLTPWRIARATRAALLPLQLCAAAWQLYCHAWGLGWRRLRAHEQGQEAGE